MVSPQLLRRFDNSSGIVLSLEPQITTLTIITAEDIAEQAVKIWCFNGDRLTRAKLLAAPAVQAGISIVLELPIFKAQGLCRALPHAGAAFLLHAGRVVQLPPQPIGGIELPFLLNGVKLLITTSWNTAARAAKADREDRLAGPDSPNLVIHIHLSNEGQKPQINGMLYMRNRFLL